MERGFFKLGKHLKKVLPTIAAFAASGGVVATTILAVKVTPQAYEKVKKDSLAVHGNEVDFTYLEAVKSAWKFYIPAFSTGAATILTILASSLLSHKQQASLVSAYGVLKKTYAEYRKEIKKEIGDEKEKEIHKKVAYTAAESPKDVAQTGEKLFFEAFGDGPGRYFNAKMEDVIAAELKLNKLFTQRGYASLNDFYDFLDLEKTEIGEYLGWEIQNGFEEYGCIWIDFIHQITVLEDGLECISIDAPWPPSTEFP